MLRDTLSFSFDFKCMYIFFSLSGSFLSASGITLVIASRISKFDMSFLVFLLSDTLSFSFSFMLCNIS